MTCRCGGTPSPREGSHRLRNESTEGAGPSLNALDLPPNGRRQDVHSSTERSTRMPHQPHSQPRATPPCENGNHPAQDPSSHPRP